MPAIPTDQASPYASTASAADEQFLPASKVWSRYGVTSMSLHRWLRDDRINFPKPIYIGRFRFWRLADLVAWEAGRPAVNSLKKVS